MSAPMRRWSCINIGLKVIAVSDHTGALHDPAGLDIPALMRHAGTHGSIAGFSNQLAFDPAQILTLPCDVLVPAAMERVIDARGRRKPEMPRAGRGRQRPDHAGCRPGAGKAPGRGVPDPRHSLQFRRRRGQLFRMGAGSAAIVLGGRGSDAARIPDPRSRLRSPWCRAPRPTRSRIAPRRWRSAWRRSAPPRTREGCFRDHRPRPRRRSHRRHRRRRRGLPDACLRARRPGSTAATAPSACCSRSTT